VFSFTRKISPTAGIAMLALFVALGGTSYAVAKLNGATIQKRSIPGNRIKLDALTGAEVKESKLGKVPSATKADDAAKLGHLSASSYTQGGGHFVDYGLTLKTNTALMTIADLGAGSIRAGCNANGTQAILQYTNDTSKTQDVTAVFMGPGGTSYSGPTFAPAAGFAYQLAGVTYLIHAIGQSFPHRSGQFTITGLGFGNGCRFAITGVSSLPFTPTPLF
jgi:hypothetical protein